MAEKRNRPSDNPPELPPGRNLGVGNASCGGHADADPLSRIVAAGARKEKLRERDWVKVSRSPRTRTRYAELRCASAFSFLDGASLPEDLVEEAARLEIPAVALVDTNGVYGAPRFYKAAKAAGIKALVGAEVTLFSEAAPSSRATLRRHPEERSGPEEPATKEGSPARREPSAPSRGSFASLRMTAPGGAANSAPGGLSSATAHLPRLTLLVASRAGYRNLCRLVTAGALGKPKGETAVT